MSRVVGAVILLASVFIAYQGYQNAQVNIAIERLAMHTACDGDPTCVVTRAKPRKVKTDVIRQQFEWSTNQGTKVVACRRTYLWLGTWSCSSELGKL